MCKNHVASSSNLPIEKDYNEYALDPSTYLLINVLKTSIDNIYKNDTLVERWFVGSEGFVV